MFDYNFYMWIIVCIHILISMSTTLDFPSLIESHFFYHEMMDSELRNWNPLKNVDVFARYVILNEYLENWQLLF